MCVAFLLFILHVGCNAFWICGLMFIDVETSQPLSLQLLLLHHFLYSWMVWQFTFYNFSLLFSVYLMLFSIYLSSSIVIQVLSFECLLVQKLLLCLWLISSSYAFLVGKFLMSIISVEFGSYCHSFICPFLFVLIFEYQTPLKNKSFFKKYKSDMNLKSDIIFSQRESMLTSCKHCQWHITLFQLWLRWFRVYLWSLEGQVYF